MKLNHLAIISTAFIFASSYAAAETFTFDDRTDFSYAPSNVGFTLLVDYGEYQFIPNKDAALMNCLQATNDVAVSIANKGGREIRAIEPSNIQSQVSRNGLTGITSCKTHSNVYWQSISNPHN